MKLVIGLKIAPKRRKTKRKETLKTPLQASVKLPKISMEQELHGITDIYVESDEEDNILEPEENNKSQDQEEYLN